MEYLSFFLKLNDGDGFVHLRCQTLIFVFHRVAFQQFWHEFLAGVVAIDFHCKGCQRYEIDTVCLLDGRQIGIAQRQSQHVTDTGIITCTGTHPQHVVIAPLNIPGVVLAHRIEDDMCPLSAIVDVA